MEDDWANLEKDFYNILSIALFACLSEVGTMKTYDARSYKAIVFYYNWK